MADRENKISARIYIEILGKLASPLLTGSGEELTDMDLLMTESGIPLISGSTLAGSLRGFPEKSLESGKQRICLELQAGVFMWKSKNSRKK